MFTPKLSSEILKNVPAAFNDELIVIPVERLLMLKAIGDQIFQTKKYQQILSSVREVGIIEPPVVNQNPDEQGRYFLLDGHLRIAALKSLGGEEVICLMARDDEAFTYNKHVNRIATVQEHKMICRAIDRGVSVEKLAAALNIDVDAVMQKRNLLNGICPEAVELLSDQMIAPGTFPILRKMKPLRQIEVATLMNDARVYTRPYVQALLAATPKSQLVSPEQPRRIKGLDETQMSRMEVEMESLQREYRLIEETLRRDVLNLTLAKGYLSTLLGNSRVVRYLTTNEPEILKQFQQIADLTTVSPQQVA